MTGPICFAILALRRQDTTADVLAAVYNKEKIPFLVRSKTPELVTFVCKSVAVRVAPGSGASIAYNENISMYAHCESSSLTQRYVFVFTNPEYPARAARNAAYSTLEWLDKALIKDPTCSRVTIESEFRSRLTRFMDPLECDKIERIKKEVEETKEIMIENIEKLLVRGESIDELVKQSEDLSFQSKQYAIAARKTRRRCCTIM